MDKKILNLPDQLAGELTSKNLKKGDVLLEIDEKPEGFYIIESKNVRRRSSGLSPAYIWGENVSIGLRELILDTTSSQDVEAVQECTAKYLPSEKFRSLFEKTEWFPREISRLLSRQVNMGVSSERKIT